VIADRAAGVNDDSHDWYVTDPGRLEDIWREVLTTTQATMVLVVLSGDAEDYALDRWRDPVPPVDLGLHDVFGPTLPACWHVACELEHGVGNPPDDDLSPGLADAGDLLLVWTLCSRRL
jgi:hypothetical protein